LGINNYSESKKRVSIIIKEIIREEFSDKAILYCKGDLD